MHPVFLCSKQKLFILLSAQNKRTIFATLFFDFFKKNFFKAQFFDF